MEMMSTMIVLGPSRLIAQKTIACLSQTNHPHSRNRTSWHELTQLKCRLGQLHLCTPRVLDVLQGKWDTYGAYISIGQITTLLCAIAVS
eukprot:1153434-Pelagomonas_calceolata.AAC.6